MAYLRQRERPSAVKLAVVGYVPPSIKNLNPEVFLRNLEKNKPDAELLLYSDFPYPGVIQLKGRPDEMIPEDVRFPDGTKNTFALNNLLFLTGLLVAKKHDVTHMLYVECDCRFGRPGWDSVVFEQYFRWPVPAVAAGSAVCYNPCNAGREGEERWYQFISQNRRRNFPIPTYGFKGAAMGDGSAVFVNGALGVYDMSWLLRMFKLDQTAQYAQEIFAWDFMIGFKLWKEFGLQAYDMVAHLPAVFSSYGDVLTTEEERLEMLRSGEVVAVHQIKSSKTL